MIDRDGLWVDPRDVCEWSDAAQFSQAAQAPDAAKTA